MKAALAEPEIVTRKSKPVSVIVPIKNYEGLLERVEDAGDMVWLEGARKKLLNYRPLADHLEVWRAKDTLSAGYGHDLDKLFAETSRREKASGHQVVNLQTRPRKA
jgi:hypothetical protein